MSYYRSFSIYYLLISLALDSGVIDAFSALDAQSDEHNNQDQDGRSEYDQQCDGPVRQFVGDRAATAGTIEGAVVGTIGGCIRCEH